MNNEKTLYIRNNHSGNDIVTIHNDDTIDILMEEFTWYIKRYKSVILILDLDDRISFGSVRRLYKALRTIVEYNDVVLDITLKCDKLFREYDFYDDIKKIM